MRNRVTVKLSLIRARSLRVAAIAAVAGIIMGTANGQAGEVRTPLQGGRGTALPATPIQGYRVGEIKVAGARLLKSEFLAGGLGHSGDAFDESRLREALEAMKKLYGALGYINFVPSPVLDFDEQKKVVNLTVNVDEGRRYFVHRISFIGKHNHPRCSDTP